LRTPATPTRREFLRKAGLGSVALASLPALVNTVVAPAWAADQTNFRFVSVSQANTIGGVQHRVNISGDGEISPGQVIGDGSFNHFNNASPVPKTLLAFGTWKTKRLISFNKIGTYGALAAGVLEMEIHLIPVFPVGTPVTTAMLKVVCNIGSGGLFTGQDEGATLTIPGAPFGSFTPIDALSVFTTGVEERN
jgi:hypothetical protein